MSDAELLEALGLALVGEGWCVVPLHDDGPVRLRVFHPSMPGFGETVRVMSHRSGPWFRSSTLELMAWCDDIPRAVAYVERELGALVRGRAPV
ncbi:hypothetical protein GCM10010191_45080 [Actinomadura vinacea]|uniref:MmcQ/YjbR family DNA-binding protein n=1 Tax=Actinomadura vinacea TaxID=115336 RepID=A0ABN3JEK7_9ACTN